MSCDDKNQSAINEARDQLFLDTADNGRLDNVTGNLGMDRPGFGFDDDEWRAVAKAVALQPKQIRNQFYRMVELCMGPQYARVSTLKADTAINDKQLLALDPNPFIQLGTLVIDPTLPTEETVKYCIRDLTSGTFFLKTALRFPHAVIPPAANTLAVTAPAGSGSVVVFDSSSFPVSGFPYPVMLDRGTLQEEIVQVINNNTLTNTLTLFGVTTFTHDGPDTLFVTKQLTVASVLGQTFVQLNVNDTRSFPATGYIRINHGGGADEVAQYFENDVVNNALLLKTPLKFTHAAGEHVEQVTSGALVEICQLVESGIHWNIHETAPREVQMLVPKDFRPLTMRDASWLHGPVKAPFSTTLSLALTAGNTVAHLTSVSGLPFEAGMIQIGTDVLFYDSVDPIGLTVTLTRPAPNTHIIASVVTYLRLPYTSTNLEQGNFRDAFGVIQLDRFAGGYIFDNLQRGVSAISTFLSASVPPIINVASTQMAGRTNVETSDAQLWPAPPFTPFQVRIGENTGLTEDRLLIDRTLARDVSATVGGGGTIIGATTMTYVLGGATQFPESDGTHPAGYRVIINHGGAHEEIALIAQNTIGGPTFSFMSPLTKIHAAGETILMLNDVLTFDALTRAHSGPRINPSTDGETVHAFVPGLTVSPAPTGFPSIGGWVWLNFGKEILNQRKRIVTITDASHYILSSTANFPTSGYPYQVVLGEGTFNEEHLLVSNNNTGTNTLTFASPAVKTHVTREYVSFYSGEPEVIEYRTKLTGPDRLEFLLPQLLQSRHLVGERVIFSPAISASNSDGSSFGFKMPPDPSGCLKVLFEFIRAAGIKVTITVV